MAIKDHSLVGETTTSTGGGALALAGAIAPLQAFGDVLADGEEHHCYILGIDGAAENVWEEVRGTYTASGNTFTPTVALRTSNGDTTLIDWDSGTKQIIGVVPGFSDLDAAGRLAIAKLLLPSATLADVLEQILTTRGDIGAVGASGFARLAVGGVGTYLGSDGIDAAWRKGPWTVLSDQTISGTPSSLDFANLISDDYDEYELHLSLRPETDDRAICLRFGIGSTPTYSTSGYEWGVWMPGAGAVGAGQGSISAGTTTLISLTRLGGSNVAPTNNAVGRVSAVVRLIQPRVSGAYRNMTFASVYTLASSLAAQGVTGWGNWVDTTALTSLRVLPEAGNLAAGRGMLIGRKWG